MSSSSFARISRSFIALSTLALLGLGCGSSSDVKVTDKGSTLDIQGTQDQGLRAGEDVTIPDSFPKDIPHYANGTTKVALKDGNNYTITQKTSDDIDTVIRDLDQQLVKSGYTLTVRLGNVGEAVQIVDYGNVKKQTSIRLQVSQDVKIHETMIIIVQVPKVQ